MQSTSGVRGGAAAAAAWLDRVAGSAWFAYVSIFLLQSKLLWGIWEHRDLTSGDTSTYFRFATQWAQSFQVDAVASPLYTVPWGSMQWLSGDPFTVTIVHRVLIAMGATLLVLAVLRRLLSPRIAWALAVWWTVLPVDYDHLYEVHLYALITSLVAVLIACRWRGLPMRSAVFAVLLLNTLLMRGEMAVALVVWTAVWLAYEVWLRRAGRANPPRSLIRAFGIPLLIVAVIAGAAVAADPRGSHVISRFSDRQAGNACQTYAYGYQQRNSDFRLNPFTSCTVLAERQFGQRWPTWADAVVANPRAVAGHFAWNALLVPQGLQLMLFDAISGGDRHDPDYVAVHTHSTWSAIGLIGVTGFLVGGLVLLWRDRRRWWLSWIRERAWGWLALIALATMAAVVMVWQRPRPEYLYALTVLILAVIGISAMVYADRWPVLKRVGFAVPLVAVLLLIVVPSRYGSGYQSPQLGRPGRPLKAMVDRLFPMRSELQGNRAELLATYSTVACNYIGGEDPCKAINWKTILSRNPGVSVGKVLRARGVDFIYIDAQDLEDPARRAALAAAEAAGWTRLPVSAGQSWLLLGPPA